MAQTHEIGDCLYRIQRLLIGKSLEEILFLEKFLQSHEYKKLLKATLAQR